MVIYRYLLISITIFALYQMLFFYLIRPYYISKLASKEKETSKIPEVAFEVVYLLILVLGLAVAPIVKITPYLLWGVVLLIYGLAIRFSEQSFFLASALLFKLNRSLGIDKQLQYHTNVIFAVCIASGLSFLAIGFLLIR